MKRFAYILFAILYSSVAAQTADSSLLHGIHWYANTDSINPGDRTDVEDMTGDRGIWVLEITHVDASKANAWDLPAYHAGRAQKIVQGKGHSLIYRIQPNWARNVPHTSDPYTLTQFADDCKSAADTLKNYAHIWQIGNEVNLRGENKHWNGSDYATEWEPTPEQYAAVYEACRDKIHEVTPNTSPAIQIVLMQPVSPGAADGSVGRFMGGAEFLWRQIEGVSDKAKIDGFALHGYAESGGTNYGVDGFWDSIREQLMVIAQQELSDRPIYITEFNKHMPDINEARIGAAFLHRAFSYMNQWNTGSSGQWPGEPNHNIISACWFVYPEGWNDYSLLHWKGTTGNPVQENDPWQSFLYSSGMNLPRGAVGGGPAIPVNTLWWSDSFDGSSLDTASPLPDWKAETTGSGSVVMSGTGAVRFLGNSSATGGGGIRTAGYVYSDFHMEAEITITNAARAGTTIPEANFDVRLREEDKGYSITFFTSLSPNNPGRIILRRTNDWAQIGSYNVAVPGGINSGDTFHVKATASGSNIRILIYKNGGITPVVDWDVNDSEQKIGWIRLMTWNMNEARVNDFKLGGVSWSGLEDWYLY